jgi:hypothetical protein
MGMIVRLRPWDEPTRGGFEPLSLYVEEVYASVLGPTATLLLRRMARRLAAMSVCFLDLDEEAKVLGVGGTVLWRAIDRLEHHGAVAWIDRDTLHPALRVRSSLPPLAGHRLDKLPKFARAFHDALVDAFMADRAFAALGPNGVA